MPVDVYVPTRLRVDPAALFARCADIEDALAAAVGRALKNSRDVVLAARGGYVGVRVNAPEIHWSGDGLGNVSAATRTEVEERIATVVADAVKRAGIPRLAATAHQGTTRPLSADATAAFDPERYDSHTNAYEVPAYQEIGKPLRLPLQGDRSSSSSASAARVTADMLNHLREGDQSLLIQLLLATGSQDKLSAAAALDVLSEFGRRYPAKLRDMLSLAVRSAERVAALVVRTDDNIVLHQRYLKKLDLVTAVVRVMRKVSTARPLLARWEQNSPGTERIIGLVEAVVQERRKLRAYLDAAKEKTDRALLDQLDIIAGALPRVFALVIAGSSAANVRQMVYSLEEDLVANYRWLAGVLERLRDVDGLLGLYRLVYGGTADTQDEVVVLADTRARLLSQVTQHAVPTAALVVTLLKEANELSDYWRSRAGDRKMERLKQAIAKLGEQRIGYSDYYGAYRSIDKPYNQHVEEVRAALRDMEKAIESAKEQPRSAVYLSVVRGIEQKVPELAVKTYLLPFWYAALQIMTPVRYHDIGSASDQRAWSQQLSLIRQEIERQYTNPEYATLTQKMTGWKKKLEQIQSDIQRVAKREFWITLGLTVIAIVITAGVGATIAGGAAASVVVEGEAVGAAAGGSTFAVVLGEAGAFTLTTSVVTPLVLGKSIDPADVVSSFAENTVMFGAFRVLNVGLVLGARALAPGRALVQMGIIFGSNTLLTTGVPLLISTIEQHRLPENADTFVLSNLLLNAVAALVSGPRMLKGLRDQAMLDMVSKLEALRTENTDWLREMQAIIEAGGPTKPQFESAKTRGGRLYTDLEEVLKLLGSRRFTDQQLAAIDLTRSHVQELSEMAAEWSRQIVGATYEPPPSRALPPPEEVVGKGLVPTTSGAYEYNPAVPALRPAALVARLSRAGYRVTDEGGGVLGLISPEGPTYLLLPARPDVDAPALASLIRGRERLVPKGVRTLQQQGAVPPLESRLSSMASTDPETTRLILAGIGRYLAPTDTQELQGIWHALEAGASPRVLAAAVGLGRNRGAISVKQALRQFGALSADEMKGLDVVVALLGTSEAATDTIAGIAANYADASKSVYGALRDLAPSTDSGLREVLSYLRSADENRAQAALGSLLATGKLLAEHPGSRVDFEFEVVHGGRVRVIDIRLKLPGGNPLESIEAEVKEITRIRFLGVGNAVDQFARDLARQAQNPPHSPFRPLARLLWLIRRPAHTDGTPFSDAELTQQRQQVKDILRRAFQWPNVRGLPERAALENDFEQHFDDIVRFF